jgi:alpha-tubulin suppressor-like RCC1 family protein
MPAKVAGDLTFISLATGHHHACGITRTGQAWCWGENDGGQLGDGTVARSAKPVRVVGNVRFRSVSAGLAHSCGLAGDGRAYCWGSGAWGALGSGSETGSRVPVQVKGAARFAMLSAGSSYTCGVDVRGAAHCWGSNELGQLGDGTAGRARGSTTPRPVTGGHVFRSVSASFNGGQPVTCGVTIAGQAMCWGFHTEAIGQRDLPEDGVPGFVDGDLVFESLRVGFSHACGVVKGGDVYCWGDNRYGQLGDGSTDTRLSPAPVPIGR